VAIWFDVNPITGDPPQTGGLRNIIPMTHKIKEARIHRFLLLIFICAAIFSPFPGTAQEEVNKNFLKQKSLASQFCMPGFPESFFPPDYP
jgi:hypothetical protein